MWPTQIRCGIRGQRRVEAAAGMADQNVAGLQHRDDRVAAVGQRRLLVDPGAVPRQVDGDPVMAKPFQLGDRAFPAPRGVKTAVHEDESHALLLTADGPAVEREAEHLRCQHVELTAHRRVDQFTRGVPDRIRRVDRYPERGRPGAQRMPDAPATGRACRPRPASRRRS